MTDSKLSVRVRDIDLIVYDFDGVMTDNRVIVFQDGIEAVIVNRADGLGYVDDCVGEEHADRC